MTIDLAIIYTFWGMINAMLLLVWFKSRALVEYAYIFQVENWFHISEYTEVTKDDPSTTYSEYMAINYPNFITRLLNCPKCVAVQLSLWGSIPVFLALQAFVHWICWIFYPANVLILSYFSLLMYHFLNKMMKHE